MRFYSLGRRFSPIVHSVRKRADLMVAHPQSVGALFLGCGLSITLLSVWAVGSNSLSWAKEENMSVFEKVRESISAKLQVEVAHLAALEGLYDASNEVEEDEFASFIDAIFEGSNGLV